MSPNLGGWVDRVVGWCFSILLASIALYCAVKLITAILPAILTFIGAAALVGLVIGGLVVVIRTWLARW